MTADEIRAFRATSLPVGDREYLHFEAIGVFLREIAAQLAELNERLKPGNFEANIIDCSFERGK